MSLPLLVLVAPGIPWLVSKNPNLCLSLDMDFLFVLFVLPPFLSFFFNVIKYTDHKIYHCIYFIKDVLIWMIFKYWMRYNIVPVLHFDFLALGVWDLNSLTGDWTHVFCNHHHHPSLELFHFPKLKLCTHYTLISSFPLPLDSVNRYSIFCLY